MRALLALLVLATSLVGCALPAPRSGLQKYQTLRASILPTGLDAGFSYASRGERLAFATNRPAYVALFEITPGAGTSLLYPAPGYGRMDGFTQGGVSSINFRRHNAQTYIPTMGRRFQGPRFLFLVASERPLELAPFGAFGYGLRSVMGTRFAALNAYDSMERLAETVLPTTADDGSWTTDMYVTWPDGPPGRGDAQAIVRCNGYSMVVPYDYISIAELMICEPDRDRQPRPTPTLPGDSAGPARPDTAGPAQPGRRRPMPKAEDNSFRERITSSSQLEEAERREAARERASSRPSRRQALDGRESGADALNEARRERAARAAGSRGKGSAVSGSAGATEGAGRAAPREGSRREPAVQPAAPASQPRERPAPSRPSGGGSDRPSPSPKGNG